MEMAEEMQVLAQAIIDSYEMRVKIVSVLMRQTNKLLKDFHLEQAEMANELRDRLAQRECLRKKDFDVMMEGIRVQQREREREVDEMLENFRREEEEMIAGLREILVSAERTRLEDFQIIKDNILTRQKEREREVGKMLRNFHLEQEELRQGLRRLLEKGESVRIKDFKAMIKGIQVRQKERESEFDKMLEVFRQVCEEVDVEWQKLVGAKKRQ